MYVYGQVTYSSHQPRSISSWYFTSQLHHQKPDSYIDQIMSQSLMSLIALPPFEKEEMEKKKEVSYNTWKIRISKL